MKEAVLKVLSFRIAPKFRKTELIDYQISTEPPLGGRGQDKGF